MDNSSIRFEVCPMCSFGWNRHEEITVNRAVKYQRPDPDVVQTTYFRCGAIIRFKNGRPHLMKKDRMVDDWNWIKDCPRKKRFFTPLVIITLISAVVGLTLTVMS